MKTKTPLKMHVVRLVNDENDENQTVNTIRICATQRMDKRWYINALNDDYNANCETSF